MIYSYYYVNIFLNLSKGFVNCIKFREMKNKLFLLLFYYFLQFFLLFQATPPQSNLQQSIQLDNELNIIYQNNHPCIRNYINGNIKIYSIIGNIIMEMNIRIF